MSVDLGARQEAGMNRRVQCLDPSVEDLGKAGDLIHRAHRDPRLSQGGGGPSGGYEVPAELD